MQDLSLHILDIAENSINASATKISIKITEDTKENILSLEISDNGKGMDEETIRKVYDPFFTTKACKRTGLGIPLLAQSARECNGDMIIKTEKGRGTAIHVSFQYDHIDRKPLGAIGDTIIVLIASHPEIDLIFVHRRNDSTYSLSTSDIRKELDGIPVNSPAVINYIKEDISAWLNSTGNMLQ